MPMAIRSIRSTHGTARGNPYHPDVASKGGVLMHAFLDADVVVRHPEGFRWVEVA